MVLNSKKNKQKQKNSTKKILITGINGSGASFLAEYIIDHQPDYQVHGITRWHSTSTSNKNLSKVTSKVSVHECDLNDFGSILRVLKTVKPDYIFHIASHANVKTSFTYPLAVLQNNIMGTANLFEAIRAADISPRTQLCSTSEVYGQVDPKNVPIREDCPMNPMSPYAISKTTQDHLGKMYFEAYGIPVIRTRMFTHTGYRRTMLSAECNFARQIARIENGLQEPIIKHGNLNSVRTWANVKDAVKAYYLLVRKGKPGEVYNIGGKVNKTIGEMLDYMISLSPMKDKIKKLQDPALVRKIDVNLQIVDYSKFKNDTGWEPEISFEDTIKEVLDYWRKHLD